MAYQEADAGVFFGRDEEIAEGLDLLNRCRRLGDSRLVMLLGASGSGKSSVVRAGSSRGCAATSNAGSSSIPSVRRTIQSRRSPTPSPGLRTRRHHAIGGRAGGRDARGCGGDGWQHASGGCGRPARPVRPSGRWLDDCSIWSAPCRMLRPCSRSSGICGWRARTSSGPPRRSRPAPKSSTATNPVCDAGRGAAPREPAGRRDGPRRHRSVRGVARAPAGPSGARLPAAPPQLSRSTREPAPGAGHAAADFLGSLQASPALAGIRVEQLSLRSVRRLDPVITRPALTAGIELESGLVETLVADAQRPEALPLLASPSVSCTTAWASGRKPSRFATTTTSADSRARWHRPRTSWWRTPTARR